MFNAIKAGVSLLDVFQKDTGLTLRPLGDQNWAIEDERDHGGCPFCSHNDCFRIRHVEGDEPNSFMHCFSCGEHLDVIGWRAKRSNASQIVAARDLAKEYDISVPSDYNPIQELFDLAAGYYENCMWNECNIPYVELGRKTPAEYQKDIRKHSEESLRKFHIGWSDGGLIEYLGSIGFEDELLERSGLMARRSRKDFFPSRVFIYPQYCRGRVSHFTFKDPLKKLQYQLPKKCSLNGYLFYNQDSLRNNDTVIIVEGENDVISVCSNPKAPAVIGTIGQISAEQLEFLRENLKDKRVVTIFDPDEAGDKYRVKVEKHRRFFKALVHVLPPDGKDIDDHIRAGENLELIIKNNLVKVSLETADSPDALEVPWEQSSATGMAKILEGSGLSVPGKLPVASSEESSEEGSEDVEQEGNHVIQKRGAYYKVKWGKEGPEYTKISDFVVKLQNVFLTEDGDRQREVLIIKQNGFKSAPFLIDSETKVSLKPFKTLIAKAADADFRGREEDLSGMWQLVYAQSPDNLVRVPRTVGRHSDLKLWIFRNKVIQESGVVTEPDKDGIFWLHGNIGVRPESLNVSGGSYNKSDIPFIETSITLQEKDELVRDFLKNLSSNLNSPGVALICLGWIYSSIYSDLIFSMHKGMPFLFFWGTNGKGKTTVAKWLQDFFGMRDHGSTSVPLLKSGVGWARKSEYYGGLPLMIDEVRTNDETRQHLGTFRAYYDREGRTMGARDGFGVKTQAVRSNFIFVGEDQFEDPATRERCIPIRVPATGRETVVSYRWMEDHKHLFSGIAYHWILESCGCDKEMLKAEIRTLDRELVESGCPQRISKNWAAVGVFAQRLAEQYMPEYDFKQYILEASAVETVYQKSDTTLMQFFEIIEGMIVQDNPKINHNHISVKEGKDGKRALALWYSEIYRQVRDANRGMPFSKNAVRSAIKEEPYFLREAPKLCFGLENHGRPALVLDLEKCPDVLKSIADTRFT